MPQYQIVNGTSYHVETPASVIDVVERARLNRTRLHVSYGNAATGLDWLEEFDISGYVGRSMGYGDWLPTPTSQPEIGATTPSLWTQRRAFSTLSNEA